MHHSSTERLKRGAQIGGPLYIVVRYADAPGTFHLILHPKLGF